jgi:TonB family protein
MKYSTLTALLVVGGALAAIAPQTASAQASAKANAKVMAPPSLTKTYPEEETNPIPEFTGGQTALRKFLTDHVIVPPFALNNQLAGAVDVEFVLTPDGQMDSLRVTNGVCCGLDEEALRVARLTAGKWKPGQIQGTAVRTRVDLPITFRVQNKNSRSVAYVQEMKVKYTTYQGSADYAKDQKEYEEKVSKQTP